MRKPPSEQNERRAIALDDVAFLVQVAHGISVTLGDIYVSVAPAPLPPATYTLSSAEEKFTSGLVKNRFRAVQKNSSSFSRTCHEEPSLE